jgi:DNA-binding winged helix-turn-helix (wHTH) protein
MAVLAALAEQPGVAISREELHAKAWGKLSNTDVTAVNVAVHALRQRLGEDAREPRYLCTVPAFGYRLEGAGKG